MTEIAGVQPPPERFNFAAHLLARNAARHGKAAFVDDAETLSYGALDEATVREGVSRYVRAVRDWYGRP